MSSVRHFIKESIRKTEIDEFLWREFERAGYGAVDITMTPLGTNVVLYVMRPGIVIGRGGKTIKDLARVLEEKFQIPNPQISVAEIEVPELNPNVMVSRIAAALRRGVHFRRAGFWALNQIMDAGALGVEIVISGKLRTDRARREKFRGGYLAKAGDVAVKYVRKATTHIQLKPGILGVRVEIMPPEVKFPDEITMLKEDVVSEMPTEPVSEAEAEAEPQAEVEAETQLKSEETEA